MELSNHQNEKIAMFNQRRDFVAAEPIHTLFYANENVKNKNNEIIGIRVLLDKAVTKKLADNSGVLPAKTAARDKATTKIGNKARACAVYFQEPAHQDLEIAAALAKPKTFYDRKSSEDIPATMDNVRSILFANETALSTYGVNTAWFTALDILITKMVESLPAPKSALESEYAGDAQINRYIIATDTAYEQMDALVIDAFDETNHNDVTEFLATAHQSTVGTRHNIVDASMKLAGRGINLGKIEIRETDTGTVTKVIFMDAHGLGEFICRNNDFYAVASANGCVTQTILFKPIYRGTFHLDFEMVAI